MEWINGKNLIVFSLLFYSSELKIEAFGRTIQSFYPYGILAIVIIAFLGSKKLKIISLTTPLIISSFFFLKGYENAYIARQTISITLGGITFLSLLTSLRFINQNFLFKLLALSFIPTFLFAIKDLIYLERLVGLNSEPGYFAEGIAFILLPASIMVKDRLASFLGLLGLVLCCFTFSLMGLFKCLMIFILFLMFKIHLRKSLFFLFTLLLVFASVHFSKPRNYLTGHFRNIGNSDKLEISDANSGFNSISYIDKIGVPLLSLKHSLHFPDFLVGSSYKNEKQYLKKFLPKEVIDDIIEIKDSPSLVNSYLVKLIMLFGFVAPLVLIRNFFNFSLSSFLLIGVLGSELFLTAGNTSSTRPVFLIFLIFFFKNFIKDFPINKSLK